MRGVKLTAVAFAAAALAGCAPLPPEAASSASQDAPRIVTTERGGRGGRLVVVGERGARLAEITELGAEPAIDSTPAFSPDGRFVAFASTRGRRLDQTSLWLADARGGSGPRRLTEDAAIDRDPVWGPDARWLVFASSRAGSFDLYRVPLDRGDDGWPRLAGEPERLTSAPTQELSPSLSPDGRRLVFMAIDERGFSRLWTMPVAGGAPRQLTDGPIDVTPAWGPGGQIAFAAADDEGGDADLFLLDPKSGERRRVVRGELGDETGPRWSADGRHLFATAVFRSAVDGRALLSSLVVVDLREEPAVLRALCDPAAVESRLGVALAPVALDADALRENQLYADALRRAVRQEEARRRAAGEPGF